jgi:uncharacterized membrane protein
MPKKRSLSIISKKTSIIKKKKPVLKRLEAMEDELKEIKTINKKILQEEKKVEEKEQNIQAEQQKIEKTLFKIGNFEFKRKHLLEFIKGIAGAFLGVGLGRSLLNMESLADKLGWWNIVGILLFILIISSLLIYKNEKQYIQQKGHGIIWKKLAFLYFISLIIEFFSLWLFASLPPDMVTLIKILVIGSYAAMAGAVSFSLI